MTTAMLSMQDVAFRWPGRHGRQALDGVNLEIEPATSVALLGPNGSGKSTLLKIACGLLRPTRGTVLWDGRQVRLPAPPDLGMVFQFVALDRHMTIAENLRDQAALYGLRDAARRIDDELARAELTDRRHDLVKTLSTGLARRADLVRAVLHEPSVLLLDEPTAGLDPTARRAYVGRLLDRVGQGGTVVLATHFVDEAERCNRVVMLHQGRVVADGSPRALRDRHGAEPSVMIRAADPPSIAGLTWSRSIVGFFTATTDDPELVKRAAERLAGSGAGFTISQSSSVTLAEVFERLTGSRLNEEPPPAEVAT